MTYSVRWDVCAEPLATPEEASAFITEQLTMVNPQGTHGVTLWFGPAGAKRREMPLRLDLDPEPGQTPQATAEESTDSPGPAPEVAGAAAVRWLPEALLAVEAGFDGQNIQVMEDSSQGLVPISAELARVSIPTAIKLAGEYLETGERPASVAWQPVPAAA